MIDVLLKSAKVVSPPTDAEVQRLVAATEERKLSDEESSQLLEAALAARNGGSSDRYRALREACVRNWYGPDLYATMVQREKQEQQNIEKLIEKARRQGLSDDEFKRVCFEMFYQYWNSDDHETVNRLSEVLINAYEYRLSERGSDGRPTSEKFRALYECLPENKTDRYWYCDSCAVQDAMVAIYCGTDGPVTITVWDPEPSNTDKGET